MLGGPGEVVEIDEMYYKVGRKYKLGALRPRHFMGDWVFGLVWRGTGYHFDVVVTDRNAETLGPIIREHVLPGTIVCTDEWAGYDELSNYYDHRKCGHSHGLYSYVDRTDGLKVHINTKEGFWGNLKVALRARHGIRGDAVALEKFVKIRGWRQRHETIFIILKKNLQFMA
jgi:transposase-like protein